jgi:hypothetical protein
MSQLLVNTQSKVNNQQLFIEINQQLFTNNPNTLGLNWKDVKALRDSISKEDEYLTSKLTNVMLQVYKANPNPFDEAIEEIINLGHIKSDIIIHPKHWNEWVNESSINPIVALLNFQSINTNPKDFIKESDWIDISLNRNLTVAENRLYDFLGYLPKDKNGNVLQESLTGWLFTCINPQTGLTYDPFTTSKFKTKGKGHLDDWGYCTHFKPDKSPLLKSDDKPVKYLCPKPDKTNKKISTIFFNTGNNDYWNTLLENKTIPILLTEGGKKAACGLAYNIPTVCLLGTYMGSVKEN